MRILITGAAGISGRNLVELLEKKGDQELFLTDERIMDGKNFRLLDMADGPSLCRLLSEIRPQQIYNLCGSFSNDYERDYGANVLATMNILQGLMAEEITCRVLLVGSAAEYGLVSPEDNPVDENHPLKPVSVYGLTKAFQTQLMDYYVRAHKLDIVMARTFNLLGQGGSELLFVGRLYGQIEDYLKGKIPAIKVYSLDNRRDYIHVSEAVMCYEAIMNTGLTGEVYNVGRGYSISVRGVLQDILEDYGLSDDVIEEETGDRAREEVEDIYADISKLQRLMSGGQERGGL